LWRTTREREEIKQSPLLRQSREREVNQKRKKISTTTGGEKQALLSLFSSASGYSYEGRRREREREREDAFLIETREIEKKKTKKNTIALLSLTLQDSSSQKKNTLKALALLL